jgi:hypothetical protein
MADRALHSPAFLAKLIDHDPITGSMIWRERPIVMFQEPGKPAEAQAATWNRKNAGTEVFTIDPAGYRSGRILGVGYRGHRIMWALCHGSWPLNILDHINGDRADNRLVNLREINPIDNSLNLGMHARNTSGVSGVWKNKNGSWTAVVHFRGRKIYLGQFPSIGEAAMARAKAECEYGFHPNHGKRPSHSTIVALAAAAVSSAT